MLKVISTGKGGVGKTTAISALATMYARSGRKVLVIDTDPSMNLAMTLGLPYLEMPTITGDKEEISGELDEVEDMSEVGRSILESHSRTNADGIRVIVMGAIPEEGNGCLCSAVAIVKLLLSYIGSPSCPERFDVAFVDSQAGPEILGRGLAKDFDCNLVLTEPTPKSAEVSRQVVSLAKNLGVRRSILLVNKSESEGDPARVAGLVGLPEEDALRIRYDRSVVDADRENRCLLDAYPDAAAVQDITAVRERIDAIAEREYVRIHCVSGRPRRRQYRRGQRDKSEDQRRPYFPAGQRREIVPHRERRHNRGRFDNGGAPPENKGMTAGKPVPHLFPAAAPHMPLFRLRGHALLSRCRFEVIPALGMFHMHIEENLTDFVARLDINMNIIMLCAEIRCGFYEIRRKEKVQMSAEKKDYKDLTPEERLERAQKPGKDALKMHPYYGGKIEVVPKACVRSFDDFAIWYSPGVAEPCKDIAKNPDMVYEHTWKWNTVAVVSDGTRVLGLGDIGPEAAMPVMEGKGMLFKYLGGVDCVPICLDTKDPDKIIETVRLIAPSFGGINLEDISNPKCFDILDELRRDCKIPVWHDDQQGTATVEVAGAINAMKLVGKKLEDSRITVIGAGAASIAIARLMLATGFRPENMCMCDSKGILNLERKDVENSFKQKWEICKKTNGAGKTGGMKEAFKDADIVIAASKPGPGTIPPEYVDLMADDPIIFATANPVPEIWPWEAKEHGCKVFATGRSDFPNQVNNSMGFPAIFRGVLDVRAKTITDEMCIAAARSLAKTAEEKGISAEYIVPTMSETDAFIEEAVAVGMKAQEQGVARLKLSAQDLRDRASFMINRSRSLTAKMMSDGFIREYTE